MDWGGQAVQWGGGDHVDKMIMQEIMYLRCQVKETTDFNINGNEIR